MGGCLLIDNLRLGARPCSAISAAPPDPPVVGERWRDMWLERLETMPPWSRTGCDHQRRDAYWRHGSVCEDYRRDHLRRSMRSAAGPTATRNADPAPARAACQGPRKGLIGPWAP